MTEDVSAWSPEAQEVREQQRLEGLYNQDDPSAAELLRKQLIEELGITETGLSSRLRCIRLADLDDAQRLFIIETSVRDQNGNPQFDEDGSPLKQDLDGWFCNATAIRKTVDKEQNVRYEEVGVFSHSNGYVKTIPLDDALQHTQEVRIARRSAAEAARNIVDRPKKGLAPPEIQTVEERQAEIAEQEQRKQIEEELGDEALETEGIQSPEEKRLRGLYSPILKPAGQPSGDGGYDHFFTSQEEFDKVINAQALAEQEYNNSPEGRAVRFYNEFVTPENEAESLRILESFYKACPEAESILKNRGIDPKSSEAVTAIRENEDVRYEFAKLLTDRLDVLAAEDGSDLGDRIINNSYNNLKVDQVNGRDRYLSRQYAVLLALHMLGGSFSWQKAKKDDFQDYGRKPNGQVTQMQHRHAALMTLTSHGV